MRKIHNKSTLFTNPVGCACICANARPRSESCISAGSPLCASFCSYNHQVLFPLFPHHCSSTFASFPQLTVSPAIWRAILLRLEATAISLQDYFLLEVADRPSSHHLPLLVTACSYTLSLPRLNIASLPQHCFLLQVLGPFSLTPLCPPLHDLHTPLVAPSSNQLLHSICRSLVQPTAPLSIPHHRSHLLDEDPLSCRFPCYLHTEMESAATKRGLKIHGRSFEVNFKI